MNNQAITATNGSTAIQAKGNLNVTVGVTVDEVRIIATEVTKSILFDLSREAKETAEQRINEITELVIKKLLERSPEGLNKVKEPDFQMVLLMVQKEYAKNGDKKLGDFLVDLLVERSMQANRSILHIVLEEAIATFAKLTEKQLAALSIIFLFKYTTNFQIKDVEDLGVYLDAYIQPLIVFLSNNSISYQHLVYTGCGSIAIAQSLEDLLRSSYQGLFVNFFHRDFIVDMKIPTDIDTNLFDLNKHHIDNLEFKALNKHVIHDLMNKHHASPEQISALINFYEDRTWDSGSIKNAIIKVRPYMNDLFTIWNNTLLQQMTLTSVGIALAHANIKTYNKDIQDLSFWISD